MTEKSRSGKKLDGKTNRSWRLMTNGCIPNSFVATGRAGCSHRDLSGRRRAARDGLQPYSRTGRPVAARPDDFLPVATPRQRTPATGHRPVPVRAVNSDELRHNRAGPTDA